MFKVDYDEVKEFGGVVAEGEYEVVVNKAIENVAQTGTQFMDIQLIIRNDIDQKHKNQYIFAKVYQSKETQKYHSGMVNGVCKALGVPNGTNFKSVDEMMDFFNGKAARVTIKHEEYKGDKQARVQFWNPSKFTECNHEFKKVDKQEIEDFTEVSSDDVPF